MQIYISFFVALFFCYIFFPLTMLSYPILTLNRTKGTVLRTYPTMSTSFPAIFPIHYYIYNKKNGHHPFREAAVSGFILMGRYYIIPPMPPPIPGFIGGIAGVSSFFSAITHSVVRNIPAIEAAFSKATRVTLAGSTTPAACKFS